MPASTFRPGVAVLALLAGLSALSAPVAATHAWDGLHWARAANPFVLKVGNNAGSAWRPYLAGAAADWSEALALDVAVVRGNGGKDCRPTRGRVEACAGRYGDTGWVGLAQVWARGGHVLQARVLFNGTYFARPEYDAPAWRRLVACQEVAHAFGLDHQDEGYLLPNLGTCMDYTDDPDGPPSNEHPNAHDYQEIEAIYAHGDGGTAAGRAGRAGETGLPAPPLLEGGSWVRRDLYLQEVGGTAVLTWVTWARH